MTLHFFSKCQHLDIEGRDGKLLRKTILILSNDWCFFLLIKGLFEFHILMKTRKIWRIARQGVGIFTAI